MKETPMTFTVASYVRFELAIAISVAAITLSFPKVMAAPASPRGSKEPAEVAVPRPLVDYINPMIGAGSSGGIQGKTFPGAATPFGLVQLSPDSITGGDNGSGYSYTHTSIEGFSFTHMSGVGWYGDLGNFLVMPTTGKLKTERGTTGAADGYRSRFSHSTEVAEAGYYAVTLSDYKIRTELTAAPRAGILRFTFPKSEQSRIQVDLARRVGGTSTRQFVKVVDASTIEGWMKCPPEGGGWGDGAGKADYTVYFSAQFSVPLTRYGVWSADIPAGWSRKREDIESRRYRDVVAAAKVLDGCREMEGEHLGFYTEFPTTENQQVLMKAGISFVSVEGARANLRHDISDWDFEHVRGDARELWSHALAGVAIEGASDAQKETFATALYHSFIDPRSFSDTDGLYTGADHKIHETADYTYRTIFSGWDVYRSQYPLLTIIRPDVVNDTVNSLMQQAELSGNGYLARWEIVGVESGCMIGDPAVSVITDAYLKGIRGYDVQRAYELCRQSVMGPKSSRQDLKTYIAKGFVPNSISWTLENCYCDYCAGRFAEALGKTNDARVLLARSRNYRNIYDPSAGNMRAKTADGTWTAWKGATVEGQGCVESNPYQQTWFVPHDVAGLIELMGKDYFLSYLTTFFEKTPASFQWNEYYNHSNEPVHHCVYLFTYAGQPWRTQQWARFTLDHAYGPGIRGLCGDEDVGQMSAWYLLSAIGIHPVSPVDGVYIIGSPLFSKVSVRLDPKYGGHGTFTVIAHNNSPRNPYIQSAKLNGKPLERAWLYYREIVAGATLELVMGPEPNQTWGAAPAAAPPSLSDEKGRASVLLTSAVLAQQTASPPVREWPSMKLVMHRNLEYAQISGKSLTLDLYLPRQPKSPLPVLVWLHGEEGWFVGKYPSPIASMVGNEYAVASIDYRSASEAKFPAQLDDCKAAVRWLRANAEKYHLDVNHVGAWGWSDGGRLAVLLGTSGGVKKLEGTAGNTEQSSRVQAVVDFCGPASLEQDAAANPVRYASSGAPPILILHGDADRSVASGQSRSLDAALRKAGVKSTFNLVNGAGHDFKELRQGAMAEAVSQFLDEQLKGGAHVRFQMCRIDPPDDAWVDPIIDEPEGTHYKTFPAPTLGPGGEASYLIYLPPDYDKSTNTRYPVLYYLHGGGGSQRVGDIWVQKLNAAIREGKIPPMISVMAEGLPNGRFLDSPDGKMPIESVIMKDLIPHIDATYRTIPRREARALEGLSMGGYGAFHLGFKYPKLFGMISGICNGISAPGRTYSGGTTAPSSASDLAANPFTLAEKNLEAINGKTLIRIIVGSEDFTLAGNEEFHGHLLKLGIPHEYKVVPGISHGYKPYYEIHDFSFFKTIATK